MNQPDSNNSIHDKVLAAIEQGQVKPRSRWYFALRAAAGAASVILVALILLFLISFAVFNLRQNGDWVAPSFGPAGLLQLVLTLPWLIILEVLILLGLLEILVRRYRYAYSRPLLYSLLFLAALVVLGSAVVYNLHVHESLLRRAEHDQLPLAGQFYLQYGGGGCHDLTTGQIVNKTDTGFVMQSGQQQISVIVTPQTSLPPSFDPDNDDIVAVLGSCQDNVMTAQAIREIEYHIETFPPNFDHHGGPPPPPR